MDREGGDQRNNFLMEGELVLKKVSPSQLRSDPFESPEGKGVKTGDEDGVIQMK
jgi:hypothetical protein